MLSFLLLRYDHSVVPDDLAQLPSDEEVAVECNPLANLVDRDAQDLGSEVHEDAIDGNEDESVDAVVNGWRGAWAELVAIGSNQIDNQVDVDDFSAGEERGCPHVHIHVVVAVPVTDAWPKDEAH